MRNKAIKKKIDNNLELFITKSFDDVNKRIKQNKGVILEMKEKEIKKEKNNENHYFKKLAVAFGVFIFVILGLGGGYYYHENHIIADVSIDVNPSIGLRIKANNKIAKVIAYNDEAKEVIGEMDLVGSDIKVGTNAIIGSMLKLGYITDVKNSILITVLGNDHDKNESLRELIVSDIDNYMSENDINSSLISQTTEVNKENEDLANKHNITVGKVELIKKIIAQNSLYNFDDLVLLSTNELNLLLTSNKNNVANVNVSGNASDKAYIGNEKAKSIALDHAKISGNVTNLEIELDYENRIMVYEVEFTYNRIEYDYEINATTGEIIKYESDYDDDDDRPTNNNNNSNNNQQATNYLSKARVKEIALDDANVSEYHDYDIEFEYKAGVGVYEVDFETETNEYEYLINATTGEIINKKIERNDD